MGTSMSRNGRKKMLGKDEEIAEQLRDYRLSQLERKLHQAWRSRPYDHFESGFGYEPDDYDEDRGDEYE
jgi:hypothetical protein